MVRLRATFAALAMIGRFAEVKRGGGRFGPRKPPQGSAAAEEAEPPVSGPQRHIVVALAAVLFLRLRVKKEAHVDRRRLHRLGVGLE